MQLRHPSLYTSSHARPTIHCAQCGSRIFAPTWSEYLDERNVRHLWVCDDCGYEFEALVRFPAPLAA
jgi:DNA-directed RNA polymerase subunit RPC12/RpoP